MKVPEPTQTEEKRAEEKENGGGKMFTYVGFFFKSGIAIHIFPNKHIY